MSLFAYLWKHCMRLFVSNRTAFQKNKLLRAWERRYSKSILHLFIGQPDSSMDGYHSLLVVHLKMHCADAQDPFLIDIVLGLPASLRVMWLILAEPEDGAAGIFCVFTEPFVQLPSVCAVWLIAMKTTVSGSVKSTHFLFLRSSSGFYFMGSSWAEPGCVCLGLVGPANHVVCCIPGAFSYWLARNTSSWLTPLLHKSDSVSHNIDSPKALLAFDFDHESNTPRAAGRLNLPAHGL